eukprot:TRINITY_DN11936_c0_g1_i1.p1 TRINITY_DN11936_c0_g1~~TRINITY_DN11936_c0_g1_i1.p1  ORF type:complete len:457 (-),score=94.72 TRINITY_DN11936_c0_g1_i1:52-1371(-)
MARGSGEGAPAPAALLALLQKAAQLICGAGPTVRPCANDCVREGPGKATAPAPPTRPAGPQDPRCEVLGDKPLMGQDKWLGGVGSFCGKFVYGVPGKARRVLRIHVETGVVDEIGPDFVGGFKWLRGAESPLDECLYCMPSNADQVLCINPAEQSVHAFGEPEPGDWKWHGGNLGNDGNIYGIPANATQVLKIDPRTKEVTKFGGPWPERQKWYGGVKAANGSIYGIPQCARGVLKIVPETGECSVLGDLGEGGWKYHGGLATPDGLIVYGIPCNADSVLKIDTRTDTVTTIGHGLKSGRHRNDDKYKYLGGGIGGDGKVYFFPSDAERVLCVDPATDECKLIGPEFMEGMNKWQNGFACRDGAVYAIPQRAHGVLRIAPAPSGSGEDAEVTRLDCGIDPEMVDKFEGGVMGGDGCVYCIPLRAKRVVKIVPGPAVSGA